MSNMLLEQAIIEYRIKHILKTPHLKAKYLAEYKRETGSNALDEGFIDSLRDRFSSAATKVKNVAKGVADIGFLGRGTTILGGSETFDIEKRKTMIREANKVLLEELQELTKIFANLKTPINYGNELVKLNNYLRNTKFPNSDDFKTDVAMIKRKYETIVEDYNNKKITAQLANIIVAVLRHLVIFYQDYKIYDKNLYLNEQQRKELELLLEQTKRMDLGDGTAINHNIKGRGEGDVSASYEAAYSTKLPAGLILAGASLAALGIGADSQYFQDVLERFKDMGEATPEQISETMSSALVNKGEGITQVMSRMSGLNLSPSAKLSVLLDPKLKGILPLMRMAVEFKNKGSGGKAFDELLKFAETNGNQTLGQTLQGKFSGTGKSFGDMLDVDKGTYTNIIQDKVEAVAAKPLDTLKNKFLTYMGKFAGPVLTGLGLAVAGGGIASGAMRLKGKLSSRMATLKDLVDTFKDLGAAKDKVEKLPAVPVKGPEGQQGTKPPQGPEGQQGTKPPQGPETTQPPQGPEGKKQGKGQGEVVYVYKQGGEDNNSLTRILTGLDLPSWAVKDLTSRVKKELEANNFVVKESLLNEKRLEIAGSTKKDRKFFDQRKDVRELGKDDVKSSSFKVYNNEESFGDIKNFILAKNRHGVVRAFSDREEARTWTRDTNSKSPKEPEIDPPTTTTTEPPKPPEKQTTTGNPPETPKPPTEKPPTKPGEPPINEDELEKLKQKLVEISKDKNKDFKTKINEWVQVYAQALKVVNKDQTTSKKPNEILNDAEDLVKDYDYTEKGKTGKTGDYLLNISRLNDPLNEDNYIDPITRSRNSLAVIIADEYNRRKKPEERDAVVKPENPQGPQKPEDLKPTTVKIDSDFLRSVMEFASDTTVENDKGKEIKFTRKQIFDNPKEFLNALSADEKRLYLRLSEDPNKEPSKFDFFKMSSDERKQMYMKMKKKQSMFDYGNTEKADTKELKKKIQNLYNLIQSPNTPENKKKQAKEELPKLQKDLKDAEQRGTGREFKSPTSTPYTGPNEKEIQKKIQSVNSVIKNPNMSDEQKQKAKEQLPKLQKQLEKAKREIEATSGGVFNISDLRNILRTGHSKEQGPDEKEQRRPIPDEKIRAAQKAITSYLSPYLKKAGVALRESQLNNVALGFINEINKRFDNTLFESRMNRWKILANIK